MAGRCEILLDMVYLITGIAGFIGSSLAHALLERGETVRGIDNFSTGRGENLADIAGRVDVRDELHPRQLQS